MRICMAGACGRMGRRILEMAAAADDVEIGGAFDIADNAGMEIVAGLECGKPVRVTVGGDVSSELANSDVLIDFTAPTACIANAGAAALAGVPVVIGTTGLSGDQISELRRLAGQVAVVHAPNMSIGVNLLFKLTSEVAAILGPEYNVEIVEVHHNQKKDSPSGTAKKLASIINLDNSKVHAIRAGEIFGEHEIIFAGNGEVVRLSHSALSRRCFANGAVRSAVWLADKSDGLVHSFSEVLGIE